MDPKSALLNELKLVLQQKNGNIIKPSSIDHKAIQYTENIQTKTKKPKSKKKHEPIKKTVVKEYNPDNLNIVDNFETFFSNKICNYLDLLPKNTRNSELRKKHGCILQSDIDYLSGIFNQIRNYFYKQPFEINGEFIIGGVYINYLPKRAHKTQKLYIVNYRCKNDLNIVQKVIDIAKCYQLILYKD